MYDVFVHDLSAGTLSRRTDRSSILTMSSLLSQDHTSYCAAHTVHAIPAAPQMFGVPSALSWPSAIYATAMSEHPGVVLSGIRRTSSGGCRTPPTEWH